MEWSKLLFARKITAAALVLGFRYYSGTMGLSTTPNCNNVIVSSARLVPLYGSTTVAHSTRERILKLLEDVKLQKRTTETSMIIDITATTWNWDTYAIVGGKPAPIVLRFDDEKTMEDCVELHQDINGRGRIVSNGRLVPQTKENAHQAIRMVWIPKGSILKDTLPVSSSGIERMEFVFEAPVDPNNDRLEEWEQAVVGDRRLYRQRARLAHECMRNMVRFFHLDRIVCWDLSWGIWEAEVVRKPRNPELEEDGFPRMTLSAVSSDGTEMHDTIFPASLDHNDDGALASFYESSRPISPELLEGTLKGASGYYLVGGNTYTMSLFHHMWDQQSKDHSHMQLVRNLLATNELCYLGHSAGAIMSGPNILTATFKGIDAFSIVTQPYNAPFLRLPPNETQETFFVSRKNDLEESRLQMLRKMEEYQAWKGYAVVEGLTFPHYDSRPRFASFPQSAETYLRATNPDGNFDQPEGSFWIGHPSCRNEPESVTALRTETNAKQIPCYPIANGHAILLSSGKGTRVVEALSPSEDRGGILHWDTYMPNVPDSDYQQYAQGRRSFAQGSFTGDENTLAGDRSYKAPYQGARIFSRLKALGLPNPLKSCGTGMGSDALFRTTNE